MTVRSKQIIDAFYVDPAKHSYFFGCSTGRGQALHEALQFPGDYDGIVAGAPAMNMTHQAAGHVWDYAAFNSSPVNMAQRTAITAAIVKQCADKDGGLSSDNFLVLDVGGARRDPLDADARHHQDHLRPHPPADGVRSFYGRMKADS